MRDHYRYSLWDGHRKVYLGITENPSRRELEHEQDKIFDRMEIESPRVCYETARNWERDSLETYRDGHNGNNPKYNIRLSG